MVWVLKVVHVIICNGKSSFSRSEGIGIRVFGILIFTSIRERGIESSRYSTSGRDRGGPVLFEDFGGPAGVYGDDVEIAGRFSDIVFNNLALLLVPKAGVLGAVDGSGRAKSSSS